jgi:hypothetical protein
MFNEKDTGYRFQVTGDVVDPAPGSAFHADRLLREPLKPVT